MNEHYVTSREWSERLKKAGVQQVSEFYWTEGGSLVKKGQDFLFPKGKSIPELFSAYLTDELAGMLPPGYVIMQAAEGEEPRWLCCPREVVDEHAAWEDERIMRADTPPNALAAMVEYCKQKGLI